jgi:hypothetical protein
MLHESERLKDNKLDIVNDLPLTIEKKLLGQQISILFHRGYENTFKKEDFPSGVYLFDIGKIQSVMPDTKCDGSGCALF